LTPTPRGDSSWGGRLFGSCGMIRRCPLSLCLAIFLASGSSSWRRSRLRLCGPQRDLFLAEVGRLLPSSFTSSSAPLIKPACWSAAACSGTKFLVLAWAWGGVLSGLRFSGATGAGNRGRDGRTAPCVLLYYRASKILRLRRSQYCIEAIVARSMPPPRTPNLLGERT
jgi:hypothetical protein